MPYSNVLVTTERTGPQTCSSCVAGKPAQEQIQDGVCVYVQFMYYKSHTSIQCPNDGKLLIRINYENNSSLNFMISVVYCFIFSAAHTCVFVYKYMLVLFVFFIFRK